MGIKLQNPRTALCPETNERGLTYLGYHEVLHTSYLCMDQFQSHVVDHKVVKDDPALREAARKVSEQLGMFYQIAAEAAYNFPNN